MTKHLITIFILLLISLLWFGVAWGEEQDTTATSVHIDLNNPRQVVNIEHNFSATATVELSSCRICLINYPHDELPWMCEELCNQVMYVDGEF